MADVRKEQCASIGRGAVLAEHPQMVASGDAFEARAENGITKVLSQLDGLVHGAVSIAQIR